MDDSTLLYQAQVNEKDHTISLKVPNGPTAAGQFAFTGPEKGVLELEGTLKGEPVKVRLKALERSQFLLLNRGFHWIQEFPFNR